MMAEKRRLIIHINVAKLLEKIFILLKTVKPIDLMRYLVRLVTPKNGICLDPYLGSGTTAIACEMEKFSWIGIELMPEYAEIAKARIGAVKDYEATLDTKTIIKESIKEDKEKELGIMNIFDFIGGKEKE
jgi:DNA modification methylase